MPSLKVLYPTHAANVAAVTKDTHRSVASGYLLERAAKATIDAASKSEIGN